MHPTHAPSLAQTRTEAVRQEYIPGVHPLMGGHADIALQSWAAVPLNGIALLFSCVPLNGAVTMNVPDDAPVTLTLNDAPRYAVLMATIWCSFTDANRRSRLAPLAGSEGVDIRT